MIARLVVVLAIVALAALAARWWQARQGRLVTVASETRGTGSVVSALLFTTPTCRHCPGVRSALATVGTAHPHFAWREIDAAQDVAAARRHGVLRAPTVLFLDAEGVVVGRASGAMGPDEVAAAVGMDPTLVAGTG